MPLTPGTTVALKRPYRTIDRGDYQNLARGVVVEALLDNRYGVHLTYPDGTKYGPAGNPITTDFCGHELEAA